MKQELSGAERAARLADLKKQACLFGAVIEEDGGGRRNVYQACAPYGKVWQANDCKHIRIDWPEGSNAVDRREAIRDAISRISGGVREMNETERFECDEPASECCKVPITTVVNKRVIDGNYRKPNGS